MSYTYKRISVRPDTTVPFYNSVARSEYVQVNWVGTGWMQPVVKELSADELTETITLTLNDAAAWEAYCVDPNNSTAFAERDAYNFTNRIFSARVEVPNV